jgi:hypothetical protein
LVAAILGAAGTTKTPALVHLALVPVAVFFFLDVMYLSTEVAYRDLYERVVQGVRHANENKDAGFSRDLIFEAKAHPNFCGVCWAIASWSMVPYYGLLLAYLLAIAGGLTTMLVK